MAEGRNIEIGYINVPKRSIDGQRDIIDVKDVMNALNNGVKQDISGESKVIEGNFPQVPETEEESRLVNGFEKISNKIENGLNKVLGLTEEYEEEEEQPKKVSETPEKIKEGNVIKVDFSKNKK